jgi:putative endonuclease
VSFAPLPGPFRLSLGDRGEMAAWNFLLENGYSILEKNYRCRLGEIDVVAQKGGRIVFFEIKTRASAPAFGMPEEAVHRRKQKKMIQVASLYLAGKGLENAAASFAVVAVDWADKAPRFRLIENAFEAGED